MQTYSSFPTISAMLAEWVRAAEPVWPRPNLEHFTWLTGPVEEGGYLGCQLRIPDVQV